MVKVNLGLTKYPSLCVFYGLRKCSWNNYTIINTSNRDEFNVCWSCGWLFVGHTHVKKRSDTATAKYHNMQSLMNTRLECKNKLQTLNNSSMHKIAVYGCGPSGKRFVLLRLVMHKHIYRNTPIYKILIIVRLSVSLISLTAHTIQYRRLNDP